MQQDSAICDYMGVRALEIIRLSFIEILIYVLMKQLQGALILYRFQLSLWTKAFPGMKAAFPVSATTLCCKDVFMVTRAFSLKENLKKKIYTFFFY